MLAFESCLVVTRQFSAESASRGYKFIITSELLNLFFTIMFYLSRSLNYLCWMVPDTKERFRQLVASFQWPLVT